MQGAGSANHGGESVSQWYTVVRTLVGIWTLKTFCLSLKSTEWGSSSDGTDKIEDVWR